MAQRRRRRLDSLGLDADDEDDQQCASPGISSKARVDASDLLEARRFESSCPTARSAPMVPSCPNGVSIPIDPPSTQWRPSGLTVDRLSRRGLLDRLSGEGHRSCAQAGAVGATNASLLGKLGVTGAELRTKGCAHAGVLGATGASAHRAGAKACMASPTDRTSSDGLAVACMHVRQRQR